MGELVRLPRRFCRACGRRMIPAYSDQESHPIGCGDEAYWEGKFETYRQALHDRFEHPHPEWTGEVERAPWPSTLTPIHEKGATA